MIEEKLKEIDGVDYFEYTFQAARMFEQVELMAQELNDIEVQNLSSIQARILNLNVHSPIIDEGYTRRFDVENILNEDEIKFIENRLTESSNLFLKSRYADYLYEFGIGKISINRFEVGKVLVGIILQTGDIHSHRKNYINGLADFARAASISLQFNNKDLLQLTIDAIFTMLVALNGNELRWILEISEIIREVITSRMASSLNEEQRHNVFHKLEEARIHYWSNQEYHLHRSFCEELINWTKANRGNEAKITEYLKEIGDSYELEAEHQQGRENKSELAKAHFYEKALQHYINNGFTEKIDSMKKEIRKAYETAESNGEFKPVSGSIKISEQEITEEIQPYLDVELQEAVSMFARERGFIPDIDSIEKQTEKQLQTFSLSSLFSQSMVTDGKKIFQVTDDKDSFNMTLNRNYLLHMQLKASLLMVPLFNDLTKNGLTSVHILEKLDNWGYINTDNFTIIKVGIERFFEKDYISSLHILVPQLEAVIRGFFGKIGYATTSVKKGTAQHEQTFNEFLEREDIKKEMPKDVHKYIQMLMVEQTGCNFRNKIAHGLIQSSECNLMTSLLILHLYLVMSNFVLAEEPSIE
ncbi:DUF4209 domain-containing protein [Paenibacillus sp. TAF43_2]|uniref:DUF4209 domain-containing protein n=1 Tax=Paenibacillus sp. TAF43_2 TaxID=3233069 RepID=UPI003F98A2BB